MSLKSLSSRTILADVIPNPPPDTWLICAGREQGLKVPDGLGILVNQGLIAFKLWIGIDADPAVMREAIEEYLEV